MRIWTKKTRIALSFIILILGFIIFCIYQSNSIVITKSSYYNPKIPADFDGFCIAHISDLHNKMFGEDQAELLNKITNLSPDIIVVTGDLIDRRKYNLDSAMTFISGVVKIAPVYYVSGNHEAWSGKYPLIKERLLAAGVHILDDTAVEISKGRSSIQIMGLADPDFLTSHYFEGTNTSKMKEQLHRWSTDENFKILLSHRPELFDLYCQNIWTWFLQGMLMEDKSGYRLLAPWLRQTRDCFLNIQAAVMLKIQRQCL